MTLNPRNGISAALLAVALIGGAACSRTNQVSYKDNVERALQQADLKDVKVSEDRDKNTITLGGTVASEDAKQKAGDVAKEAAPSRVVANEVAIRPVGMESEARKISSNLDDAIESDYKAQLVAAGLDKQGIDFNAKNGVLTLKGNVHDTQQRQKAQQVAESVPHVEQVVNQIEVKR
jgi:hyperosmotically inducible periplasmic protein